MRSNVFLCTLLLCATGLLAQVRLDESATCIRARAAGDPCVAAPVTVRLPDRVQIETPVSTVPSAVAARPPVTRNLPPPGIPGKGAEAWLMPTNGVTLGVAQLPNEAVESGQVVVYWARSFDADAALAILAGDRKTVPLSKSVLENIGGVLAVFQLRSHAAAAEFRDRLSREFPDAVVDFNSKFRPLQQSVPATPQPRIYFQKKIDAPKPAENGSTSQGVRIGIVDGRIASISALSSVPIVRRNFLLATDTPSHSGHATSIAALIAGRDAVAGFLGVAPDSVLYSAEIMRARGREDTTSSSSLVLALEWLVSEKVKVINLSLGGPGDLVMAQVFAKLSNLAVVVVAAAGNGGPLAAPVFPAAYPGVIAVTATDALDDSYVDANRGHYIALAAPGVDLWVPDSGPGHYVSGTSFAAALVSASSARLMALNPLIATRSIPSRMCQSAKDLGVKGSDTVFGCGLLQLGALLRHGS